MSSDSQVCPACNGAGAVNTPQGPMTCGLCQGSGAVESTELRQPFSYVFIPNQNQSSSGQIPANGTSSAFKQISAESDFEWVMTMATATALSSLTILFTDTTAQVKFSSDPINGALFAGTAQLPMMVWVGGQPYVFGAMTSLEMDFTDFSGAQQNNVQVVLWGYKILQKAQGANTTDATQTRAAA